MCMKKVSEGPSKHQEASWVSPQKIVDLEMHSYICGENDQERGREDLRKRRVGEKVTDENVANSVNIKAQSSITNWCSHKSKHQAHTFSFSDFAHLPGPMGALLYSFMVALQQSRKFGDSFFGWKTVCSKSNYCMHRWGHPASKQQRLHIPTKRTWITCDSYSSQSF